MKNQVIKVLTVCSLACSGVAFGAEQGSAAKALRRLSEINRDIAALEKELNAGGGHEQRDEINARLKALRREHQEVSRGAAAEFPKTIEQQIAELDATAQGIAKERDNRANSLRYGGRIIPVDPYQQWPEVLGVYESQLAALCIQRKALVAQQASQQQNEQKQGE